ncbi:MAG: DNA polymerase III subunit delta' [Candidatus Berkelbacteria bacterium]|nr:DNA polymerase III subunit delta' [Candidatus Berkelbacteria bacterium]
MRTVVGHRKVIDLLEGQIKAGNISQAYLFCGPPALGKFTVANLFAKELLCSEGGCNQCVSCQSFNSGKHPDYMLIRNSNELISIDIIRNLKKTISFLPIMSKRKVVIFEEASLLTTEAQNALLKTLEEPPRYATIILVTQKENLLPTILSRCTRINFQPVSQKEIKSKLINDGYDPERADFMAHISVGQIGRIIGDPLFFEKWEKSLESIISLKQGSLKEKFDWAKNPHLDELYFWLIIFRDALYFKINSSLLPRYAPFQEKVAQISSKMKPKEIYFLIRKIKETQDLLNTSANQRLLLENLVLSL